MQIIKKKAEPTTPDSGYGAVYLDTADDKYKIKKDTGTVVDLESGGGAVTSVNSQTGVVSLDTDDIPEGTNKYYSSSLFNTDLATKDTDDLAEGTTNLYFTDARAAAVAKLDPQNTYASSFAMSTSSAISPSADIRQIWFVKSGGGNLVLTSNPQILSGSAVGQELVLMGTDDTNSINFVNGNGLRINGNYKMKARSTMTLVWDGSLWTEISRNDI